MAEESLDERKARALLEIHYQDLGVLSRSLENGVQYLQQLAGLLREHNVDDDLGLENVAGGFADLASSLGNNLEHVAKMQARIREAGLAPPDEPDLRL